MVRITGWYQLPNALPQQVDFAELFDASFMRRKILDRVHACLSQGIIGHSIRQCQCGHVESHRQRVKTEQNGKT